MAAPKYGHAHRQLREAWRPRVEAGQVACCCGCALPPSRVEYASVEPFGLNLVTNACVPEVAC